MWIIIFAYKKLLKYKWFFLFWVAKVKCLNGITWTENFKKIEIVKHKFTGKQKYPQKIERLLSNPWDDQKYLQLFFCKENIFSNKRRQHSPRVFVLEGVTIGLSVPVLFCVSYALNRSDVFVFIRICFQICICIFFSLTSSLNISAFPFWGVWMFLFSLLTLFQNTVLSNPSFLLVSVFLFFFFPRSSFSSSLCFVVVCLFVFLFNFVLVHIDNVMYYTFLHNYQPTHDTVCPKVGMKQS